MLQQFIQTTDTEILQKHITNEFIINSMNLFEPNNTYYTEDVNYLQHLYVLFTTCNGISSITMISFLVNL